MRKSLGDKRREIPRDKAKQMAHFEKAIFWLQKTISATRSDGVDIETRIKHGPTAWFELDLLRSGMRIYGYRSRTPSVFTIIFPTWKPH